jgi:hypothetical protein
MRVSIPEPALKSWIRYVYSSYKSDIYTGSFTPITASLNKRRGQICVDRTRYQILLLHIHEKAAKEDVRRLCIIIAAIMELPTLLESLIITPPCFNLSDAVAVNSLGYLQQQPS